MPRDYVNAHRLLLGHSALAHAGSRFVSLSVILLGVNCCIFCSVLRWLAVFSMQTVMISLSKSMVCRCPYGPTLFVSIEAALMFCHCTYSYAFAADGADHRQQPPISHGRLFNDFLTAMIHVQITCARPATNCSTIDYVIVETTMIGTCPDHSHGQQRWLFDVRLRNNQVTIT